MTNFLASLSLIALTVAAPLRSQQPAGVTASRAALASGLVHYGKWGVAAIAAAFTALGAREHAQSSRVFNQIVDLCRANTAACAIAPNGSYKDPSTEQLYQASLRYDSRARTRLLVGQASLLFCAGLFFADLRHKGGGPDNIPFHPAELTLDPRPDGTRVGVRVRF